ncbi:MAG: hypothetical protein FJ040_11540, partial [Chloroflexi bacterium]|nr:hypothetical protein [Chloroflexota bacterium]
MKLRFKILAALLVMAFMIASCGGAAPAAEEPAAPAEEAPAAEPTAAPAEPAPEEPAPGGLAEVAREDSLNLAWSIANPGVTNPW